MTQQEIKTILPTLPEEPGCYLYYNAEGVVIYVGKAKNLRRRVSSYFRADHQHPKTRVLVRQIDRLEYVVVETEFDALLLENSLIKEHQPRYNVLLKDDKTYPEIVVKSEHFPRVRVERRPARDGSLRFGPYPSVQMAHTTLEMIRDIFPLRTCKLDLSPHRIAQGRYAVCLEYHMKRCKAPCIGGQKESDYDANIREIVSLLKGELSDVIELYRDEMMRLSGELRFEEAQIYKERLRHLEQYKARHTVAPSHIHNVDVFSMERDDECIYVNYLHISQGMINRAHTLEYKYRVFEEDGAVFASAIAEMRRRFDSRAREIILPFDPDWAIEGAKIVVPQRGDKKKLLELSERNAKQYRVDKYKQAERLNPDQRMMQTLTELKDLLYLERLPIRIECFDNAHLSGSDAVSACVVFVRAKPSKKDYRKYRLRSTEAGDDYGAMREVVRRRYTSRLEKGEELPDLIVADGGLGQMNAIKEILDSLGLNIPVSGLAKDDRHRTSELIAPNGKTIPVRHESATWRLLERLQAEVHRFAITFHRDLRSRHQLSSRLDYIKGVGEKTKIALLEHFGSVPRLSSASLEDIASVVGSARASLIHEALHSETENATD